MRLIRSYQDRTRSGTRLATRSITIIVLVLGLLATGSSVGSIAAQVSGVSPDLYVSGLTLFWFSFRFAGFDWVPWILALGIISIAGAALGLIRSRNLGVLVACSGWLALSVLAPPGDTLDRILSVASSGLATGWMATHLRGTETAAEIAS